jgi:alkanesulfonate monooxygenase SsuD/methylene tetrahydromethanopterin reductase-like flavin-dependent oxidoreductase (luciferase family)
MNEEAMNFGRDANIEHALRYERAEEFLEVTKALWDSLEDDSLLLDKKSGFFADPNVSTASITSGSISRCAAP